MCGPSETIQYLAARRVQNDSRTQYTTISFYKEFNSTKMKKEKQGTQSTTRCKLPRQQIDPCGSAALLHFSVIFLVHTSVRNFLLRRVIQCTRFRITGFLPPRSRSALSAHELRAALCELHVHEHDNHREPVEYVGENASLCKIKECVSASKGKTC
jgi:hypothetical protein